MSTYRLGAGCLRLASAPCPSLAAAAVAAAGAGGFLEPAAAAAGVAAGRGVDGGVMADFCWLGFSAGAAWLGDGGGGGVGCEEAAAGVRPDVGLGLTRAAMSSGELRWLRVCGDPLIPRSSWPPWPPPPVGGSGTGCWFLGGGGPWGLLGWFFLCAL